MRRLAPLIPLVLLSPVLAPRADAQVCLGSPGFDASRFRLGGDAWFGADATKLDGSLGAGRRGGPFGSVSVGRQRFDFGAGVEASSLDLGAGVGTQLPLGAARRAQLCPHVGASLQLGPNDIAGSGADYRQYGGSAGLGVGGVVPVSARVALVPWADAALVHQRARATGGPFVVTMRDTYGVLTLGASLLINQRLTVGPAVLIPLGLADSQSVFGLRAGLGFGSR